MASPGSAFPCISVFPGTKVVHSSDIQLLMQISWATKMSHVNVLVLMLKYTFLSGLVKKYFPTRNSYVIGALIFWFLFHVVVK